jgi:hypothetical protein
MEVISLSNTLGLSGPRDRVQALAARLGKDNYQSSVLVFHETGSGSAARFVFDEVEDVDEAGELICESDAEGACIREGSLTVIAVNAAQEAAIRDVAQALGVKPKRTSGEIVFVGREGR